MMTEEQRIEWLLELQDHPEQLTDSQLQQILADDEMRQLVSQLCFAKRALKSEELKDNAPDVDAEWEQFAATHAEELAALGEGKSKSRFSLHLTKHKIAASFIGMLLASGIAFAAIITHHLSPLSLEGICNPRHPSPKNVPSHVDGDLQSPTPLARGAEDEATHVFNNAPLDSMLSAIAAAYGVQVEFENDAARQLRFHFVWKREDSLTRVVEKLNTFEAVNISIEDNKLVVR